MNGECMSPESVVRFLCRFCSDDVTRPSLHSPWLSHGKCYATDGRIAIRFDPGLAPLSVERKHQCDAPLHASRDIDQWISSDYDDVKAHRREALPIDFASLHLAAMAALDSAREDAREDGVPEIAENLEELNREEAAEQNSCVILPGKSRMLIAARYATMICDTVDSFGDCAAFAYLRTDKDRRWKNGHSRILFVGGKYDILLMGLRTDVGGMFNRSAVADAATGELVHRAEDKDPFDMDLLRFGKGGAE